jgi:hypothetical protein
VLVAICTTRTLTVTTKPVSAAVEPTIAESTVLAVDAEYCRDAGSSIQRSNGPSIRPSSAPASPPSNGRNHRLPFRYWRVWKTSRHTAIAPIAPAEPPGHIIRSG